MSNKASFPPPHVREINLGRLHGLFSLHVGKLSLGGESGRGLNDHLVSCRPLNGAHRDYPCTTLWRRDVACSPSLCVGNLCLDLYHVQRSSKNICTSPQQLPHHQMGNRPFSPVFASPPYGHVPILSQHQRCKGYTGLDAPPLRPLITRWST